MDSGPPNLLLLLLLSSLLHFLQCAGEQSLFVIDTVGLRILPNNTVQSGTPVTLHCQVTISHDNIPHLTHTFQFLRDDSSIYSNSTTADSAVYELGPTRANDSGNYECRVTVEGKSQTSVSQKLYIIGLQIPVLHLENSSPYMGEEFTATCSAPEEKGSLLFRFYQRFRSGEPQTIKQPATTGNSSETKLVLRRVGDSFLYCDYEIHLASGTKRSNRSNEIQVIVKGLYISPVMNVLPSSDVYEGDIIEVVCQVVGQRTDIEVFLINKHKRILKSAQNSLNHRFRVQEGDSGELVCKGVWGTVQGETYHSITVKELISKPQLTVEPVDIFEGDVFKLTCSVSIYVPERIKNESLRFFIYRDNVNVSTSATYISAANPNKNGNYTCKVQSATFTHSFVKESQKHVIKTKVPVSKPVLSVVGGTLVLGKRFQLLCHSDNGTLPITYILYSPNGHFESRVVSKPGESAIFNSSAIFKSSDLDKFLCHAKNNQDRPPMAGSGSPLQRSTNIIEPVSEPVLAILPSMTGISEGQNVTLVCSVQRGTPPISFSWHNMEGVLTSVTSEKLQESLNLGSVRQEHAGGYYCVSTNPANETKQSHTVVIGVTIAGWKKGLIAVVCILLILVLILVIAFKRRIFRSKRRATGVLSVKSASTKVERLSLTQAEVIEAANGKAP
uniref:Platelet endothelial cell adhesion molecule n=1 Tax=Monopterus albus TaxID=43700 RepID=A0A3Q3KFN3_MONAL